jgi:hypothetical protein
MSEQTMQMQISYEDNQMLIDRKNKLAELAKNPLFDELFMKGYIEEESIRLVLLKADQSAQKETDQEYINKMLDGIGSFNQYMRTIHMRGTQAEAALSDLKDMEADIATNGE